MGFAAGRLWHHHVVLFFLFIRSSADSSNSVQAPGRRELPTWIANTTQRNSRQVPRRLFSLSLPTLSDVQSLVHKASTWIADSTLKIAGETGKLLGLDKLLEYLKEGREFIDQGSTIAHEAYTGVQELASELMQIYVGFEPLKPVFADKNGLVALLTSTSNMQILVKTVEDLLKTSEALHYLGDVLHKANVMFTEITHFLHQLLNGNVEWRRLQYSAPIRGDYTYSHHWDRRLTSVHELLLLGGRLNASFTNIVHLIANFVPAISKLADTFSSLNATFSPVLAEMDAFLSVSSRRLNAFTKIQENQQAYAEAVKEIVPSWQGVESLGVKVCPVVYEAKTSALVLACRIKGFIDGVGVVENVEPLIGKCGQPYSAESVESSMTSQTHRAPGCPNATLSSDIADLIGDNSNSLGWIMAVVAGVCGLGVVGGVAVKKAKGSQEVESDEDQLEELAPGEEIDSRG